MTEKQFTENYMEKERERTRERGSKIFHMIILACLPLFFAGYFYALYRGNNGNRSSYSLLILMFSAAGSDVLFTGKKTGQKALSLLAKIDVVLFFVWIAAAMIHLILK